MDVLESVAAPFTVELRGTGCAVVEGCGGVADFGDERVILRAGRRSIHILGSGLSILRLTEHSAVVRGRIDGVEFH